MVIFLTIWYSFGSTPVGIVVCVVVVVVLVEDGVSACREVCNVVDCFVGSELERARFSCPVEVVSADSVTSDGWDGTRLVSGCDDGS